MSQQTATQRIIDLARGTGNIDVLWLYGSRARDDHTIASDYDLAVAFNDYESEPMARRLRPEMLGQEWGMQVHVPLSIVDINQVPTPLAIEVINDHHVLFCRDELRLMQEQQRIWSKWAEYKFQYEQNQSQL